MYSYGADQISDILYNSFIIISYSHDFVSNACRLGVSTSELRNTVAFFYSPPMWPMANNIFGSANVCQQLVNW